MQWCIGSTIGRQFGQKRRMFNPSAIAYVLCLNTNYLTQESHGYNISKRKCHASK